MAIDMDTKNEIALDIVDAHLQEIEFLDIAENETLLELNASPEDQERVYAAVKGILSELRGQLG